MLQSIGGADVAAGAMGGVTGVCMFGESRPPGLLRLGFVVPDQR